MIKIITKETISRIADEIEKRKDFKETLTGIGESGLPWDQEFLHTYNAYSLFDVVIVLCEHWNSHEVQRQFLIYSDDKLREASEFEDDMLRGGDNETSLRDCTEEEYPIISRDNMNKISRGDK